MSDRSLPALCIPHDSDRDEIQRLSKELMHEFAVEYKKLGGFKEKRERFEKRNIFYRLWNSDELKNAELDSIQLQEKIAQLMGKLTILQMYTQYELADQQTQLGQQQGGLETQHNELAKTNEKLKHNQEALLVQQAALEKLVNGHVALTDLTAEQGVQLIQYAQEIKAAKDEVTQALAQQQQDVAQQIDEMHTMHAGNQRQLEGQIDQILEDTRATLSFHEERVLERLTQHEKHVAVSLQAQQDATDRYAQEHAQEIAGVKSTTAQALQQIQQIQRQLQQQQSAIKRQYERQAAQHRVTKNAAQAIAARQKAEIHQKVQEKPWQALRQQVEMAGSAQHSLGLALARWKWISAASVCVASGCALATLALAFWR